MTIIDFTLRLLVALFAGLAATLASKPRSLRLLNQGRTSRGHCEILA
ncbi:MAG: hypothetical protein QNK20_15190 [Aureibaculum sp.]|nr:hypothetical protein [Aureibaculum sp.]